MATEPPPAGRGIQREMLLATAAELFARRGYRATTLDDIAAELDIKKTSLYHYIHSKEQLLIEIYDQILDRIEAAVGPIAKIDLPVDERLRRMVHAHVAVVGAEHDMLAVMFREEAELPEPSRSGIAARKRAYERIFERTIEEGQQTGALRPLPARLVVVGLLGMCNWMYKWYRPGRFSIDEIAGTFMLLLESGWLPGADDRRGAYPRPTNLEEALQPTLDAVGRLQTGVAEVQTELSRLEGRLQDGLIQPKPGEAEERR